MKTDLFIGAACGATAAIAAVSILFGAQHHMVSASWADPKAYYTVGEKRFDWFGKAEQNCWGGHTLDGRCITVTYVSKGRWLTTDYVTKYHGIDCDPIRAYPLKCAGKS